MSGTRRRPGLLGPHVDGYQSWLLGRGYTPATVRNMLKELGQVGCWLASERLRVEDLDEVQAVEFRAFRRRAGYRRVQGPYAMAPLLEYLREVGATPSARPSSGPIDELLRSYQRWMADERGLASTTMLRYRNTARRFLTEQAMTGDVLHPETLTGADVNAFLLRECARVSVGSAKGRVAELRSILRLLYLPAALDADALGLIGATGWGLAPVHDPSHDQPGGSSAATRQL